MKMIKCMILVTVALLGVAADGAPKTKRAARKTPVRKAVTAKAPPMTQFRRLPYVGAIAADAHTGKILFSDNAERKAYPASVTKLMTALLVLEDIEQGKYKLTDRATASVRATFEQPSGVGIRPKQSMTVDDLLMALMVRSANDAAVMLAENAAGGDLLAFIARMNRRAAELGMTKTKYDSPNGLPPYDAKRRPKKWRHEYDSSTAADILKLAREVVKHPQIFKYTSTKIATVTDGAGKPLRSVNHNNILVKDKMKILDDAGISMVDGLKTGYIDAGGSSIALTAERSDGSRAIVVVLGAATSKDRDTAARSIMLRALKSLSAPRAAASSVAPSANVRPAPPPAPAPTVKTESSPATDKSASVDKTAPAAAPVASSAWGWVIIGGAVLAGVAAYAAWSWLGKSDRDEWRFEDIPTAKPRA